MSQGSEFLRSNRLLVALATYNEIENLPSLVEQIRAALPTADILVVDDNSPDGTGRWCDEQIALGHALSCIHRPAKLGLGSATAAAFRWAIQEGYDWIGTLDADHGHDPREFPAMILAAADNSSIDVVIGSRYIPGGCVEGWPWHRKIASKSINTAARLWLRLPTRDNSGAFRLYRVAALQRISADSLKSSGYACLEEVLWRMRRAGCRFVEVPITFRQRQRGKSKLGLGEVLTTLRDLAMLRFRKF